jgi:hypothetical protein
MEAGASPGKRPTILELEQKTTDYCQPATFGFLFLIGSRRKKKAASWQISESVKKRRIDEYCHFPPVW